MIRVGVVVVHHGSPEPTRRCVASVAAEGSAAPYRVVVVDNSGTLAERDVPGATLVERPDNPGYGGGANAGVAALAADAPEVIVVLNHDVELLPGFLDAAADAVSRPGVGLAGGPLYLDRARTQLWYAGGEVNTLLGTVRQSRSEAAARRRRSVGFVPGTAVAVAATAWREAGGFDPSFFLYNEDLDLCLRLERLGYALWFEPRMEAVHHLGAATGSAARSALYLEWMARNRLRPFRSPSLRLWLAAVHTGVVAVRALSHAVRPGHGDRARALVRGHLAALRSLRRPEQRI